MRAIGYYRLNGSANHANHANRANGGEDAADRMRRDFEDYCDRHLHQPIAVFGDAAPHVGSGNHGDNGGGNYASNGHADGHGSDVHADDRASNGHADDHASNGHADDHASNGHADDHGINGNGNGSHASNVHGADDHASNGHGHSDNEHADAADLPEYARMLEYIQGSRGNYLVVAPDAAHLGRDIEEVVRTMLRIEATGCKVVCADDDMPDPLQSALASLSANGVSQERSLRIKKSMRERAVLGKGLGKPPYGYRNGADGALEIVADEAPIVELIYQKYAADGLGLRLIAQYLNERGIHTRRGGRWNMVTIRDILRNPTYMGTYTRFGLRLPKSHPAIISPALFRATQDQTRARKPSSRAVKAQPFLLSGLAFCGYCENKMMGVTRRQSWRRKDGRSARGVYRYYQCQTRNNQSLCGYHTWRAPALEDAVLSQLRDGVNGANKQNGQNGHNGHNGQNGHSNGHGGGDSVAVAVAAAAADRGGAMQAIWDGRVRNAERRFLQNVKRVARGEIGLGALSDHLRELDKARAGAAAPRGGEDAADALTRWDDLEFADKQAFLMRSVAKIVVFDESAQVIA